MATTIKLQNTNYSVSTANDTLKLDGNIGISDNRIDNYYVNIHTIEDVHIGYANYSECVDGSINYSFNIPADYKVDVVALVDTSITDIKMELSK